MRRSARERGYGRLLDACTAATASPCPCTPNTRRCPWCGTCRRCRRSVNSLETDGYEADPDDVFPAIDAMRIPVDHLANLLAAGDSDVIRNALRRLAAMRGHMRKREVLGEHDERLPAAVGMSVDDVEDMFRLLAIAKYQDRYVIPQAHTELAGRLMEQQGTCGLDFAGGPGNCGMGGRVGTVSRRRPRGSCSPTPPPGPPSSTRSTPSCAWLFWASFPFSRLVHAWSIPLQYLGRPYILYRRRYQAAR